MNEAGLRVSSVPQPSPGVESSRAMCRAGDCVASTDARTDPFRADGLDGTPSSVRRWCFLRIPRLCSYVMLATGSPATLFSGVVARGARPGESRAVGSGLSVGRARSFLSGTATTRLSSRAFTCPSLESHRGLRDLGGFAQRTDRPFEQLRLSLDEPGSLLERSSRRLQRFRLVAQRHPGLLKQVEDRVDGRDEVRRQLLLRSAFSLDYLLHKLYEDDAQSSSTTRIDPGSCWVGINGRSPSMMAWTSSCSPREKGLLPRWTVEPRPVAARPALVGRLEHLVYAESGLAAGSRPP